MKTPLDRARSAHRATRTATALDQRVLADLRAPRRPSPRFPVWWVPALTTPAVLLLWFVLHDPLPPMRSVAPAPVPGRVLPEATPEAPCSWSVSRQLPEPLANHVTLWSLGETGLQSLLDEAMSYGVASGVQVSLRSSFATLDKRTEQHLVMLAGHLDWNVRYLETSELTVEALGVMFEVSPGRFSLEVGRGQVNLMVDAGQVTLRAPREPAKVVTAGGRFHARIATAPPPQRPTWTSEEIERHLDAFSREGKHERAAAFIRDVLPQVGGALRESLLVDLAAIYGQHLHDWDRACDTLSWATREFPDGILSQGIAHLRDRYRCQ